MFECYFLRGPISMCARTLFDLNTGGVDRGDCEASLGCVSLFFCAITVAGSLPFSGEAPVRAVRGARLAGSRTTGAVARESAPAR